MQLTLNVGFALAADIGSYDEERIYATRNPALIRIAAVLSLAFIPVQLYLRAITYSVWKFMHDHDRFE